MNECMMLREVGMLVGMILYQSSVYIIRVLCTFI